MKVSFIGLGLIGGSMALKLRAGGFASEIWGLDQNSDHASRALELKLIDEIKPYEDIKSQSDLIVLAIPVDQAKQVLPDLLTGVAADTVVMDVGSTKQGICELVKDHPTRGQFVATHPIAGTENFGPDAAFAQLFDQKVTILCDTHLSEPQAVDRVENLYRILEMKILRMGSKEHDLHAAYVSHLSHISSFTLGLTVLDIEKSEKTIFNLAGSGFDSTVRLAKSSPFMWAPIFEQNAEHLVEALDAYLESLTRFRELIKNRNTEELIGLMERANEIRRVLEGKKLTENTI